jgi:hypothetical protein
MSHHFPNFIRNLQKNPYKNFPSTTCQYLATAGSWTYVTAQVKTFVVIVIALLTMLQGSCYAILVSSCNARLCLDAHVTGFSTTASHHIATHFFFLVLQQGRVLCSYQTTRAIILITNCITTNKFKHSSKL